MIHALDLDKGLEVIRNGLRPGVGDDARLTTRKGFQGALHNDLHIPFGHLPANLMVDNVAAVAVQDAAQVVLLLAVDRQPSDRFDGSEYPVYNNGQSHVCDDILRLQGNTSEASPQTDES